MKSFDLWLYSADRQLKITLEATVGDIDELLTRVLTTFSCTIDQEARKINIDAMQRNTIDRMMAVGQLVLDIGPFLPRINKVKEFLSKLKENEYFIIAPFQELDTLAQEKLNNHLRALNTGQNIDELNEPLTTVFAFILDNYNMHCFRGDSEKRVGEPNKRKRVCRFCGGSMPKVSFKNVSHAISEAIGNKKIICNEECDGCNSRFGSGIESDLIAFFNLHRAFFGVSGKNGSPKIRGKNFELFKGLLGVEISYASGDGDQFPPSIVAETYDKISLQDVYRALCKFAISVVPATELNALASTVDWINKKQDLSRVPPIRAKLDYTFFSLHPSLTLYIRKNDNYGLPHAFCEFHFTCFVVVFILPLSERDKILFQENSELAELWDGSHYSQGAAGNGWVQWNLSSTTSNKLSFEINFVRNEAAAKSSGLDPR